MNEEQNPKLMALKRVAQDLAKLFGSNLASRKSKKPEEREVWQENKKEEDAFSFFEEEDKSSPKAMFSDLLKKKKEEDAFSFSEEAENTPDTLEQKLKKFRKGFGNIKDN